MLKNKQILPGLKTEFSLVYKNYNFINYSKQGMYEHTKIPLFLY